MNKLLILIPEEIYEVNGKQVVFKPFKFKQFPFVLNILNKYFSTFVGDFSTKEIVEAVFEKVKGNYLLLKDLCDLIKICTNLTDQDFDDFQYDEVFSIFSIIVKQNRDFFSRMGEQIKSPPLEEKEKVKTGELKSVA